MELCMNYGLSKSLNIPYAKAIEHITEELKKEGFGILTTIDVRDTLNKKLGVDFPPYVILGACNPLFAYQVLQSEIEIGLFLPCNVIIYEKEGKTQVAIFDPMFLSNVISNPKIKEIATTLREKIDKVLQNL